jgi:DNA-binding transcriptional LysR family regulator
VEINDISVFLKVVQLGSFGKAAQSLKISKSTVSAKVSQLERRLAVPLLYRSTHVLKVTTEGKVFFRKCLQGIELIESAEEEAKEAQESQKGMVRITAPKIVGYSILPDILANFAAKYPQINVELLLSDDKLDLISSGVDVAIRIHRLKDSIMVCRKVGESRLGLYASPEYIKNKKKLYGPSDIAEHPCLMFKPFGESFWDLARGKAKISIKVDGSYKSDDLQFLKILSLRGHGIALLPTYSCINELKEKQLARLLPDWSAADLPIYLIYPSHRFMSKKAEVFIDFLSEEIRRRLL